MSPVTTADRVSIRRVGLSMFHISSPVGAQLLTDPWLKNNPTLSTEFRDGPEIGELDALIVSHGHYDHANGLTIAAEHNSDVEVIAPFELANLLAAKGLRAVRPLNLGGSWRVKDATVTLVPASHSSSYGPSAQYAGPACGVMIVFDSGLRVYYAGDTGLSAEMAIIRDYWRPDLAILPVGGWLTMDPEQAAYAASELLRIGHVIPCHYVPAAAEAPDPAGMEAMVAAQPGFGEMRDRGVEFASLMRDRHPSIRTTVLEIGEATTLERPVSA